MNSKITYYKELCKTILQYKNKNLLKIENISDTLFANKVSIENLQAHKKLIQDLLQMVNEKRDEIYLLKAQLEIANSELKLWVYDYDNLKINGKLRDSIKEVNMAKLSQNVNDEMAHKTISKEDKSLIVNADRYLLVSGQRNYFYDQKIYYTSEIERLTALYQKHYYKKRELKKTLVQLKEDFSQQKIRLEKDLGFLREKLAWDRKDAEVQTDVELHTFKKMVLNHEIVVFQKRMTSNKLIHFIEKIKYNCTKQKPMTQKSLINLIPELYNEKIELDLKCELDGSKKMFLDEFFYQFIEKKFRLSKIIKRNCEQALLGINKYSPEDPRIDLFRKFLGIGETKIRREILDVYLVILKNLPISFFKMFEEDYTSYLMNTEICFELYSSKFNQFELVEANYDHILSISSIFLNDQKLNESSKSKKLDFFLLTKMYNKSMIFINDLNNSFMSGSVHDMSIEPFIENFYSANKEFEKFILRDNVIDIFRRNFALNKIYIDSNTTELCVNVESFLNFFTKKYFFKVKITEYLDITINSLINTFNLLEKKINKYFDEADSKKHSHVYIKEFEELMLKLLGNTENRWKVNDFFKIAAGSSEKEYITREEFMIFCYANKEFLNALLAEIKN